MPDALRLAAVVVVAAIGSMVNAIAGGGTLLTFPALIALGIPPIIANATSTVALWPGALGSMVGYRKRLGGMARWAAVFAIPSLAGGAVGGWLLLSTPADRFARIVPWLVLGATLLFAVQRSAVEWIRRRSGQRLSPPVPAPEAVMADPRQPGRLDEPVPPLRAAGGSPAAGAAATHTPLTERVYVASHVERWSVAALVCQFLVGVYGGYFGAGIGILMLAVLGFMGFTEIHQMNGLKNWGGLCMNFVAALMFAASGLVNWAVALAMAVGALAGGYLASRAAQRVSQEAVRRLIVLIGVAAGVWLLWAPLS